MDAKEKLQLIKKYKEKAIKNLYTIVKENLEENSELNLCIETLLQFLMIKSFRKYVNIMKLLTAKSRELSELNDFSDNENNIKDEEIIKYIYRLFSDETSDYYLIDKSKNKNIYETTITSSFLNRFFLRKISHKKHLFMNEMNYSPKPKKKKKHNIKKNAFLTKFKKPIEDNKDQKNFKQLIYEENNFDKQKKCYLSHKISLTNELKYQIKITHNEHGRDKFKILLKQIESMKNENIKEYVQYINENYNYYKGEIQNLINDREKEERINNFIHNLIDDRSNISKRKEILLKKLRLEDNKFETIMGEDFS